MIGNSVAGWWLGTFHSLAARILRTNAELVNLKNTFTIMNTDDQIRLIKQVLSLENIDEKDGLLKFVIYNSKVERHGRLTYRCKRYISYWYRFYQTIRLLNYISYIKTDYLL